MYGKQCKPRSDLLHLLSDSSLPWLVYLKTCMVNVLKFYYTKVADKMAYANSADPDQTAPEAV